MQGDYDANECNVHYNNKVVWQRKHETTKRLCVLPLDPTKNFALKNSGQPSA